MPFFITVYLNILARQKRGIAKDELHMRLFYFIGNSVAIPETPINRLLVSFSRTMSPGILQNGGFRVEKIIFS